MVFEDLKGLIPPEQLCKGKRVNVGILSLLPDFVQNWLAVAFLDVKKPPPFGDDFFYFVEVFSGGDDGHGIEYAAIDFPWGGEALEGVLSALSFVTGECTVDHSVIDSGTTLAKAKLI
jgi:hypothetical protein